MTATGPIFKLAERKTANALFRDFALKGSAAHFAKTLNTIVEHAPYEREALFAALHFKLYEAAAAKRRSCWFGGRFYNRCSGVDPDYVSLSGAHLKQVLDFADVNPVLPIEPSEQYLLSVTYARLTYDKISKLRSKDQPSET